MLFQKTAKSMAKLLEVGAELLHILEGSNGLAQRQFLQASLEELACVRRKCSNSCYTDLVVESKMF